MEKCSFCNCYEFEPSKAAEAVCVCGHGKENHEEVEIPHAIYTELKSGLSDIESSLVTMKTRMGHIEIAIERLRRLGL